MTDTTSAIGQNIQDGPRDRGLVPDARLKPVWGEITGKNPTGDPAHHFQWKQVVKDERKNVWVQVEDSPYIDKALGSTVTTGGKVLNPAVERNFHDLQIGTIVRLYPQDLHTDNDEDVHRFWHFAYHQIRPFKIITQDMIGGWTGGPQRTIPGEWLDSPGETVTLYATHTSGHPASDMILTFGECQKRGGVFPGAYGWARYQPEGTIIGTNPDGSPKWRGEWQIVTVSGELVIQLELSEKILRGETGEATLRHIDPDDATVEEILSFYEVTLYNNLSGDLTVRDKVPARYDTVADVWVTIGPPTPNGLSVYASSQELTVGTLVPVQVEFDTTMEHGSFADDAKFGEDFLELNLVNHGIKNISDIDLLCHVEWEVTAERIILVADNVVDSWLEVLLYNDGSEVIGATTRMTSSRAIWPNPGSGAVNSCAGQIVQLLKVGKTLTVWIQKGAPAAGKPNNWITVPALSHMTVTTIRGERLGFR